MSSYLLSDWLLARTCTLYSWACYRLANSSLKKKSRRLKKKKKRQTRTRLCRTPGEYWCSEGAEPYPAPSTLQHLQHRAGLQVADRGEGGVVENWLEIVVVVVVEVEAEASSAGAVLVAALRLFG